MQPMVIAIWSGESKPLINDYLDPLILELGVMHEDGIMINSQHVSVKIGQIICDTPARAFIKGATHNYLIKYENELTLSPIIRHSYV